MHMKKGAKSLIYLAPSFTCGPMRTLVWWSRGESNPRPQAISGQIYMRSWLIWISHPGPRSSTLLGMPVTRSCPVSCDPARGAADVDDLAVFGLAASGPAHRRGEHLLGARDVARAQHLGQRRLVGARLDQPACENRLDLRSEQQQVAGARPVERFDAQSIAHEQQPPLRRVPQCEREHAAQPVHTAVAPLLVGVNDRLGIRARRVRVPVPFERATNLRVVVDFAVERDPDGAVLVGERLMARAQ